MNNYKTQQRDPWTVEQSHIEQGGASTAQARNALTESLSPQPPELIRPSFPDHGTIFPQPAETRFPRRISPLESPSPAFIPKTEAEQFRQIRQFLAAEIKKKANPPNTAAQEAARREVLINQPPRNPGKYHVGFFTHLLQEVRTDTKKSINWLKKLSTKQKKRDVNEFLPTERKFEGNIAVSTG